MEFDPVRLIEEVKKRPGLYNLACPADREEKLSLWKKIGAAMFSDWDTINKATAYDRVLQLQKKWRSLRDAYNREVRGRRSGSRINKKTYRYYKQMTFLGGTDGLTPSSDDNDDNSKEENSESEKEDSIAKPLKPVIILKKINRKRQLSCDSYPTEEVDMPAYTAEADTSIDTDSDKLFLMSFLPEMRQLPVDLKMWVRSQIANTMQEAVSSQYNNQHNSKKLLEIKRPRHDSDGTD